MAKKTTNPRKKPSREELRNLDQEILFLEGLVRRDGQYIEALQILGDDYTRRGRYAEGLKIDERLCQLRPDNAAVHYNLACSYSLMQRLELALEALEAALNLGYDDFKWMAKDPDLENVRDYVGYEKIKAKVRLIKSRRAETI